MTEPTAPPSAVRPPEPVVRGFMFADLRGYTEFVERVGDSAAATFLGRYRALVRSVIEEHAGAEIRTEGDSFYVVFPSPSAAVRAGLTLVSRAADDAAEHQDEPIRVGVGIHAGESAETTEGYVGAAVNLAARICSVARPGEVLVSDTVRSLTRSSLPITFVSRGRPALKGVAEPVELFSVRTGDPAAAVARPRRRPAETARTRAALVGVGAAVVVLAVVVVAALSGGPGASGASLSPGSSGLAASPSSALATTSMKPSPSSAPIALKSRITRSRHVSDDEVQSGPGVLRARRVVVVHGRRRRRRPRPPRRSGAPAEPGRARMGARRAPLDLPADGRNLTMYADYVRR